MYLARLLLDQSRMAVLWASNPYRVHQRLRMVYSSDPRLLFRIENAPDRRTTQIIAQSQAAPDWSAFSDFPVLSNTPEYKLFDPSLQEGQPCRFRLLANPTIKSNGKRLSLFKEYDQLTWLDRKLSEAGAKVLGCLPNARGLQRSRKNPQKDNGIQTHFAVLFEGILRVNDPVALRAAIEAGIGPAKGYGFGLLSLARA